jgi:hypothetical protein
MFYSIYDGFLKYSPYSRTTCYYKRSGGRNIKRVDPKRQARKRAIEAFDPFYTLSRKRREMEAIYGQEMNKFMIPKGSRITTGNFS